jgi:cyclic pyranopterin monophosphate synthase
LKKVPKKITAKVAVGMIDIGTKPITHRVALASASVSLGQKAFQALVDEVSPKGNVLEAARIAGLLAAKATSATIPMCHPIPLTKVQIRFRLQPTEWAVTVLVEVHAHSQTGVEMEALHAAAVSALTIYDMLKWADKGIVISDLLLLEKTGGKSGVYRRKGI